MTDYFFTVTLQPRMYKEDIDKQFDKTKNELLVLLKILSDKITLVTELTKAFNVHYHGIIQLNGSKRKFVNMFRGDKQFGFVNLSPIKSEQKVFEYISKDVRFTYDELERRPILRDDYKVFSMRQHLKFAEYFIP